MVGIRVWSRGKSDRRIRARFRFEKERMLEHCLCSEELSVVVGMIVENDSLESTAVNPDLWRN